MSLRSIVKDGSKGDLVSGHKETPMEGNPDRMVVTVKGVVVGWRDIDGTYVSLPDYTFTAHGKHRIVKGVKGH